MMADGARVRPELPKVETARAHLRNALQILRDFNDATQIVLAEGEAAKPRLPQYAREAAETIGAVDHRVIEALAQIEAGNL